MSDVPEEVSQSEDKIEVEETLIVPEPEELEVENEAESVKDLSEEDIEWVKSQRKLQVTVKPQEQPPQMIDVATLKIESPKTPSVPKVSQKKLTPQQQRRRRIL